MDRLIRICHYVWSSPFSAHHLIVDYEECFPGEKYSHISPKATVYWSEVNEALTEEP